MFKSALCSLHYGISDCLSASGKTLHMAVDQWIAACLKSDLFVVIGDLFFYSRVMSQFVSWI